MKTPTERKKYELLCYKNITHIRKMGCLLPIEIWEIGQEISENLRENYAKISQLSFKKVGDYTQNPNYWKGFQIKAFI